MSIFSGIRSGLRSGIRSGLNAGSIPITWTVDASSGWAFPSDATEFTDFRTAKSLTNWSNPNHLHLFQEASGPILDKIGAANFTAVGAGISYQQAATGLTRKCVVLHDNLAEYLSATIANINANSLLVIAAVDFKLITTERTVLIAGSGGGAFGLRNTGTPSKMALKYNVTAAGTGASDPNGRRIIVFRLNRATSGRDYFSDQEKLIGTTDLSYSGTGLIFGGFSSGSVASPTMGPAWCATWTGVAAQRSNQDIKDWIAAQTRTTPSWSA